MTNRKTYVVAYDSAGRGGRHHANQVELIRMSGGKISTDEQNCFSRHRQPRVFQHHSKEHGPVTIGEHVLLDELQRVMDEIHSRNFTGISCARLSAKFAVSILNEQD